MTSPGLLMKFIRDVAITCQSDECLVWPYSRFPNGYAGYVRDESGVRRMVHAVVCEIAHGPRPTALHEVAHSCGNGKGGCVNHRHVRWATRKENHADKIEHGTAMRGEKNPQAILKEEQVREIRAALKTTRSGMAIAKDFGISESVVYRIKSGSHWSSVR